MVEINPERYFEANRRAVDRETEFLTAYIRYAQEEPSPHAARMVGAQTARLNGLLNFFEAVASRGESIPSDLKLSQP